MSGAVTKGYLNSYGFGFKSKSSGWPFGHGCWVWRWQLRSSSCLPAAARGASRCRHFTWNSAEASGCGKWADSKTAETYLKTCLAESEQRGWCQQGPALCVQELRTGPSLRPDREGRLSTGLVLRRPPWCSSCLPSVVLGMSAYPPDACLTAITGSLGVAILIMPLSCAVCSGDVTTKSYM